MKTQLLAVFMLPALMVPALAAPETFDFKDPKGVNHITFNLDAPQEKINGTANGITGTVTFDPQNPGATKGKIVATTASLTVPNAMQTTIMRGNQWLDAEKYPEITFEAKELKNVKTEGDKTTADVAGTFTLKGVSKDMTVPVELNYLKDKLADRQPGQKGDLLVLKCKFTISRKDYNIQPGKSENKVADTITLELGLAGASAQ